MDLDQSAAFGRDGRWQRGLDHATGLRLKGADWTTLKGFWGI
ncbi:hypothetical protein [Calidithermus roseus]|nr:hypothetical protein [Calidithermus roseus]